MSVVYTLDKERFEEFRRHLKNLGFRFEERPYQEFLARYDKFTVNLYESGKVTFGGSDRIMNEVEWFLTSKLGGKPVEAVQGIGFEGRTRIGTDESGKGDFFGPLVVAGVLVTPGTESSLLEAGVKDSKLIRSERRILEIKGSIKKLLGKESCDIVCIGPARYNQLYEKMGNLNSVLGWAHARAIENLLKKSDDCRLAIADQFGDEKYIRDALMAKGREITLVQTPKGERDVAVAAASVLARSRFLECVREMGKDYGMEFPRGAGEGVKLAAARFIKEFGLEEFSKVAKLHFSLANEFVGR